MYSPHLYELERQRRDRQAYELEHAAGKSPWPKSYQEYYQTPFGMLGRRDSSYRYRDQHTGYMKDSTRISPWPRSYLAVERGGESKAGLGHMTLIICYMSKYSKMFLILILLNKIVN